MFCKIDEEAADKAKAKAFDAKLISELTVAEFRTLMASIFAAERKSERERKDLQQARHWPHQIVRGMSNEGDW